MACIYEAGRSSSSSGSVGVERVREVCREAREGGGQPQGVKPEQVKVTREKRKSKRKEKKV